MSKIQNAIARAKENRRVIVTNNEHTDYEAKCRNCREKISLTICGEHAEPQYCPCCKGKLVIRYTCEVQTTVTER